MSASREVVRTEDWPGVEFHRGARKRMARSAHLARSQTALATQAKINIKFLFRLKT